MKMKRKRIFWGVFFLLAAVFIVVGKLGMLGNISVISLLFTIFLAACLIESAVHRNIGGILFSIAFLCIVYDEVLGMEMLTPGPVLGAALLGTIGCGILFPKHRWDYGHHHSEWVETEETVHDAQMEFSTSFGGSIKYVNSDDFQSARLKCSFGSMKVYFDNAMIQNGNAVIALDNSFGGMELYIPKTWNVVNHVEASFGAVDEKTRNASSGTPVVTLTGRVSFGGVEIFYI